MTPSTRRAEIAARLRERVRTHLELGVIKPGAQLPGVRELAREYEVNPRMVSSALRQLEEESLVELRSRSGVYVTAPNSVSADRKAAWLGDMLFQGLQQNIAVTDLAAHVRRGVETVELRAAVIDCNDDELWANVSELERDYGIRATGHLLPDVTDTGRIPAAVRHADVLMTTEAHAEAVARIARQLNLAFICLRSNGELLAELTRGGTPTPRHFVVSDRQYALKVQYLLSASGPLTGLHFHVLGADDLTQIGPDDPLYLSPLARHRMSTESPGTATLLAQGSPQSRSFSDETVRELIATLVRVNLAAQGAVSANTVVDPFR